MMLRMSLALAASLIALAHGAHAAPFLARHGHWTVMAASATACAAMNRPPEEFNAAPFASLALRQLRDGPARLQVFAWPGVFKPNDAVTITVTADGARTDMPGRTFDTYIAETPLTAPLREALKARVAEFEITGLPSMLLFDVSHLGEVVASLEACVRGLAR